MLQGEPIFGGIGRDETCSGTVYQFIRNDDMDIMYRRKGNEIIFKDRLNGLMIKINDIEDMNETK